MWRAAQVEVNAPGGDLGIAEPWPRASVRGRGRSSVGRPHLLKGLIGRQFKWQHSGSWHADQSRERLAPGHAPADPSPASCRAAAGAPGLGGNTVASSIIRLWQYCMAHSLSSSFCGFYYTLKYHQDPSNILFFIKQLIH